MEKEGSLRLSQVPPPVPISNQFDPVHTPPYFLNIILILYSHLRLGLPSGLFPSGLTRETCSRLSCPQYAVHAPTISFFSMLSPARYWVRGTEH
jgi:hypothetical protein